MQDPIGPVELRLPRQLFKIRAFGLRIFPLRPIDSDGEFAFLQATRLCSSENQT